MECKNCGAELKGRYCSTCGQRSNVERLGFGYLRDEIASNIFQLNRGVLFTVKESLTRPGHSIRGYVEGRRIDHIRPLSFILLASAIYLIVNQLIGNSTFIDQFVQGYRARRKCRRRELRR